jgi:cell division septum initiation protein DivIVA
MDAEMIDRLREPDLAVRLWGYDRQQVDDLLAEVQKRAAAGQLPPTESEAIESQLTGVGEKVEAILAAAAETADHVRTEAAEKAATLTQESEKTAAHLRREADAYAKSKKTDADQYVSRVRAEADRDAEKLRETTRAEAEAAVAAAEEEADQILREAQLERGRIEEAIEALRERRELVIASIERMRGSLGSMVGEAEQGTAAYVAMGEDDPAATHVVFDDESDAFDAPVEPVAAVDWDEEVPPAEDERLDADASENGVPVFDIGDLGSDPGPDEVFGDDTAVLDAAGRPVPISDEPTEPFTPDDVEPETAEQNAVERDDGPSRA